MLKCCQDCLDSICSRITNCIDDIIKWIKDHCCTGSDASRNSAPDALSSQSTVVDAAPLPARLMLAEQNILSDVPPFVLVPTGATFPSAAGNRLIDLRGFGLPGMVMPPHASQVMRAEVLNVQQDEVGGKSLKDEEELKRKVDAIERKLGNRAEPQYVLMDPSVPLTPQYDMNTDSAFDVHAASALPLSHALSNADRAGAGIREQTSGTLLT